MCYSSWVHYTTSCNTQSSAPENGRDHRPKHVELIGIINKPLLLHVVGVYIIYVNDARSNKYQIFFFFNFISAADCQELVPETCEDLPKDGSVREDQK